MVTEVWYRHLEEKSRSIGHLINCLKSRWFVHEYNRRQDQKMYRTLQELLGKLQNKCTSFCT